MSLHEPTEMNEALRWFTEAGFGLFIHWGLYAIPAGRWRGAEVPFLGEWIMNTARIPIREYEPLARQFNPKAFDPREWVRMAEAAGMRYLVFTSKHHDGFAMFRSDADPYNVVDATPFRRDIVGELAEACRDSRVRLALYYSQAQDWHEPSAGNGPLDREYGNTWDFPPGTADGFRRYMDRKMLPQLTELLTRYGPIAMLWFDNPIPSFTRRHAEEVRSLVRAIQPACLISARIGHGLGDVLGFGDNEFPDDVPNGPAEICATMNDTWGFKLNGGRWRTGEELLRMKARATAQGCNLLLNVGPMADGRFPPEAVERMQFMADHVEVLRRSAGLFGGRAAAGDGGARLKLQQGGESP